MRATEAFQSATSLERLQQGRRSMCLVPLGMQALRTHEAQDKFNGQNNRDETANEQGHLLGFQMAIMERVCAETRRLMGETLGANPNNKDKGVRGDVSPRQTQRNKLVLYIGEATQRRALKGCAADVDKCAGNVRDAPDIGEKGEEEAKEQRETEQANDNNDEKKKRMREDLVMRIRENTVRRQWHTQGVL